MKIFFFTGSHPRHMFIANMLHQAGLLHGLLIETREEFVPPPPAGLADVDRENFIRHFRDRSDAEKRFFGSNSVATFSDIPIKRVNQEELNGPDVSRWVMEHSPDVVISYGVHMIREETLNVFPKHAWNIHGGLSPWYRGNITLFWPFYFLQPNWAGMTIHKLTSKLDGGPILHHSVPKLERGDGVHDVACRAVVQVAKDLVQILTMLQNGKEFVEVPQKSNGKLFTSADWKPQHLRLIYNYYNNDIVDRYLDGELGDTQPPLIRAF